MDLKRWVMVDFSGSPLEWGILICSVLGAIWCLWFWSRQFWRTKFGNPEWRKYADGWSWVGIGILAVVSLGAMALGLGFVMLNAVWYLTH